MSIRVKFFASLREKVGKTDAELNAQEGLTALNVWQQTTDQNEIASNVLIAVNMEYVDQDQLVADNDEVAFFPPVTGG